MKKILIIGAGFGGLSVATELSIRGFDVTLLEAHIYPGGSAGTFYHQGYRFDAGATLVGGFAPGAVMDKIGQHFAIDWQASLTSKAMLIHLKDNSIITRWTDSERWKLERMTHFGSGAEPFWVWQESTADALWDLALRLPSWPPQSIADLSSLAKKGYAWVQENGSSDQPERIKSLILDAFQPVGARLPYSADKLRQFIDAQLLIAAQTTSRDANALYGSVALDLARQGVAHVPGGVGSLAEKMVDAVRREGGRVHFRQEVKKVSQNQQGRFIAHTKHKQEYEADLVIFNLPPWNIAQILTGKQPRHFRKLPDMPQSGWGAFMLYLGLDSPQIDEDIPLHHQVVMDEPLGEGNSIFMSLSPVWDATRAPTGKRALTISTHTNLEPWWHLYNSDQTAYDERKIEYTERVLTAGERVLPGLKSSAELVLPGTPITFQRFTRRYRGWVGGFPQTSLFRAWGPRISRGLWMVGDSVFPGQSVPAVMLAGLRVARAVETREEIEVPGEQSAGHSYLAKLLNSG
ncbi:MAG: FAD-dependent oxidoreductase [Anaerolineales bacterium]|nr:FAD-dependent oxidoreductase [Anaerolineales bacterium]